MGWMLKYIKDNKKKEDFNKEIPVKLKEFEKYKEKLQKVKDTQILKNHFENTFYLKITGQRSTSEKEESKRLPQNSTPGTNKLGVAPEKEALDKETPVETEKPLDQEEIEQSQPAIVQNS